MHSWPEQEDVAHIAVFANREAVGEAIDTVMHRRGYSRQPLRGRVHLLSKVSWASPYDPPPQFRCFLLLPDHQGWTTVVDELDLLDRDLCASLSHGLPVLSVRGAKELDLYEYQFWAHGQPATSLPPEIERLIESIRANRNHVSRFLYDELGLTLGDRMPLEFRGYKRLRKAGRGAA